MCLLCWGFQSVCWVVQEDFREACIEAWVNDVCGDVWSLPSRSYHVTDSGTVSWFWHVIRNIRGNETQWRSLVTSHFVEFVEFFCDLFKCHLTFWWNLREREDFLLSGNILSWSPIIRYAHSNVGPCASMHMSQTKRPRQACSWSQKPNY